MMTVGSVAGTSSNMQAGRLGMNGQTDSVSRNIRNQIANAQKKLQDLSSDTEMKPEEKMKKRQEIQQEIASLNQQLRQHEIELRKEQQPKGNSMDDMLAGSRKPGAAKSGGSGNGLSGASMKAMISADASMKQAQVFDGVAVQMDGRAGVLEAEIKQDAGRGASAEKKKEELADVQKKSQEAVSSQMSELASANKKIEEAQEADEAEGKNMGTDKVDRNGQKSGEASKSAEEGKKAGLSAKAEEDPVEAENTAEDMEQPAAYKPIDIRL
jgi:hypothetical protein